MSLKHLTIGIIVAICTFVAPGAAQQYEQGAAEKNELSGSLGRTFIADQGIQGAPAYDPNLRFGKGRQPGSNHHALSRKCHSW